MPTISELKEIQKNYEIVLQEDEKARRTWRKYSADLTQLFNMYDDSHELTKLNVIDYKQHLVTEGYKIRSINSKIISLNKFFNYCDLKELKVKQLKYQQTKSLQEVLTIADYKRLLRHAKAMGDHQTYMIMKILAETGIRIGELKYFTVENLDFYIQVNNKGKFRTIIVRQDLLRELRKYCKVHKITTGTLFEGDIKGKQVNESTIRRHMNKIAAKAHVKKTLVHPHMFRHFFAINYLNQNNNNVVELADILGHESIDTTRIYVRTTDQMKRKKLENMHY